MLPTPEDIRTYIAAGLDCVHIEVTGDGSHFEAVIVSTAFAASARLPVTNSSMPPWAIV